MRRAFANKVDATAAALIAEAKAYGAQYLPINGTIDGALFFRGRLYVVDWKGEKGALTAKQRELLDAGWPIWFISTSEQLRTLLFSATGEPHDA